MTETPEEQGLPPSLRLLKTLVTVLMVTMIVGVITVVGLLVTRMQSTQSAGSGAGIPALPAAIILPEGATAQAVTFGTDWTAIVTQDQRLLVYGKDGTLRQEVVLTLTP